MRTVAKTLAVAVLLIGGCVAFPERQSTSSSLRYDFAGVDKVAIVSVEGALASEAAKDQIADFFLMELLDKGYAPVGRTQVRAQLREREPDWEGAGTSEEAVQVGLALDVPAVLAIKIPHFGQEISMTAQMINVEDGSTLWLASDSGRGSRSLSGVFGFGASSQSDDQLLGSVPGGPTPLGGPLNSPLTPAEADKAREIVAKMCRSLPKKSTTEW